MAPKIKLVITLVAILFISAPLYSQFIKGLNYAAESGISFSDGDYAPFWLTANKHGLSSVSNNHGYVRAGIFRPYEENKKFTYSVGLDLAGGYDFTSSFIIQQAYVDLKYNILELSVGSKEREPEFRNPMLSSGNMTSSRNARPIPQVRAGIPEYRYLTRNKMFAIKGYIAYGAFTDDNWQKDFAASNAKYTENALYHSKAIFFKIGNEEKKPFVFEGNFEMASQFGGRAYNIPGYEPYLNMPNKFVDFLKVFIASGSDATDGEYSNVYGNHLGSWNASLSYHFPKWKIRAYYEHYFEDHSMIIDEYAWKEYVDGNNKGFWAVMPPLIPSSYYWKDCMVGVEVTFPQNPYIETFVYEYLATREQSGSIYHDHTAEISDQIGGRDNYYNHGIYTGWQHWGMAIGHPFLTSPIYNKDGTIEFKSNRVKAHHVGISGHPHRDINYRILLSHTKSWGIYSKPYLNPKNNFSSLWELKYTPQKLNGWEFSGSFAFDRGKQLGNNTGGMITIRKVGLIN